VLALSLVHVPESRNPRAHGRLDWLGAVLATLGLGGIVYGLIQSSKLGFADAGVLAAIVFGVLALAAFVGAESREAAPMIPPSLFRSKTFVGANLMTLLLYAGLGGALFFVPLNFIQVQHYSATAAGAALLPFILLMAALSRWSGGLVGRYGARMPLIAGPLIAAAGFALLAWPAEGGSYWLTFFPAIFVLGLGMAIAVAPLTTVVMNAVDVAYEGAASGVNNAASRVAVVIAIALFGVIFAAVFNAALDTNLARAGIPAEIVQTVVEQRSKLAAIELPATLDAGVKAAANDAIAAAFVKGFRAIALISALLAAASAFITWTLIEDETTKRAPLQAIEA
jgi:predicted MFS family arabinose efflux permease